MGEGRRGRQGRCVGGWVRGHTAIQLQIPVHTAPCPPAQFSTHIDQTSTHTRAGMSNLVTRAEKALACYAAHLHVNGAAARNHVCMLECTTHDHDCIMQTALRLVNELLTATAQHKRRRACLWAACEEVVPLPTNLRCRAVPTGAAESQQLCWSRHELRSCRQPGQANMMMPLPLPLHCAAVYGGWSQPRMRACAGGGSRHGMRCSTHHT